MGKLIVVAMSSVDGYYEGPEGAGDLMPMGVDDGFNRYNAELVSTAAAVVIGHHSFKDFSSYWPDREGAEEASAAESRFARMYNPLLKLVASREPSSVDVPQKWSDNTRVIGEGIEVEVARLKKESDADVVVWGSRNLWTQLWEAGLVDELHVVAGTGVAGGGTPVFPSGAELTPRASMLLPGTRCVVTTYAVG